MKAGRTLVAALAVCVSLPAAADGRTPMPTIAPAKPASQCVAAPAQMRREHMNMLKHQRDDTVRGGVRGAQASLKACVDCHAGKDSGSVAKAAGDFCISCHTYAAVRIDCFECHASTPQGQASAFHGPLGPDHHSRLAMQMRARLSQGGTP